MTLLGVEVNTGADYLAAPTLANAFKVFLEEANQAYLREDLDTSEFSSRIAAKKADGMKIFALGRLAWTLRYKGLRADQAKDISTKEEKYNEAILIKTSM